MTDPTASQHCWRSAELSGGENCVEVARSDGFIFVRDAKGRDRFLTFSLQDWSAFIMSLKERAPRS